MIGAADLAADLTEAVARVAQSSDRRMQDRRGTRAASPGELSEPTRAPEQRTRKSPRARRRRTSRFAAALSSITTGALVATLAAATAFIWFDASLTSAGPLRDTIAFKVTKGQGARAIASRLSKAGVIDSEQMFMARYMQMHMASYMGLRQRPVLKAGSYEFEKGASVNTVMASLERGRGKLRFITFPEGRTSYAIVSTLERDDRLTGDVGFIPAEGALLPSTYDIQPGMERTEVIKRMMDAQADLMRELWNARAPNLPIKTPEEAIILASVVQREMGPNDDPERIAAVFHNRLRKGMRLQSDPTILYGIFGGQVNWGKPILKSEIRTKTAHNTYQIPGLPPSPICNPGRVAIKAVLQPAESDDLYFVADGKGGHWFSRTLAEHRAKTREWRKIERAFRKRQREEARLRAQAEKAAAAKAATTGEQTEVSEGASERASANSAALRPTTAAQSPPTPQAVAIAGTQDTRIARRAAPGSPVQPSDITARGVTTVPISATPATDDAEQPGQIPLPTRKPVR